MSDVAMIEVEEAQLLTRKIRKAMRAAMIERFNTQVRISINDGKDSCYFSVSTDFAWFEAELKRCGFAYKATSSKDGYESGYQIFWPVED